MIDRPALEQMQASRFFEQWDEDIDEGHVAAAEASVRQLVADVLALGPGAAEPAVRQAVARCIQRFNDLDDGWIATIEREDIGDAIHEVVRASGSAWDDDWMGERDW